MAGAAFRSSRDLRAWLERGEGDGEEVFTDQRLRERLADPMGCFENPVPSSASDALPAALQPLAVKVEELGLPKQLLRLLGEDKLRQLAVVHFEGESHELWELNEGALPSLAKLLHWERCEALQALAVVLRGAHDDGHPFAAQCRELSERLLSQDLEKKLWELYVKVSACPRFSATPEHKEVETVVKQGLELQLCVLECLLLAGYDPQISRRDPEQICRIAEECYRQRFLGSLPRAAHLHHWLLGDAEICGQAQCVGDLLLMLLVEHLDLETIETSRHALLASPEHLKHLQKLMERWLDLVRHTVNPSEATPATAHCGRHAALSVLAFTALLALAPEHLRDAEGLKRLFQSAVFQSELLPQAVRSLQERGFMAHGHQWQAARAVARGLVATAARAFNLDALPAVQVALAKLAAMAYRDLGASLEFWRSEYPSHQEGFLVLHGWLLAFPHLAPLLELLTGLAQGEAVQYVAELLKAPLKGIRLPYRMLSHISDFEDSPGSSMMMPSSQLVLREPAYVEELALRTLGLELPEAYVASAKVLRRGARGQLHRPLMDPELSPRSAAHVVQWALPEGVSVWRVTLCAWDALLCRPVEDSELLRQITRCMTQLLHSENEVLEQFLQDLPDTQGCYGLAARLLASLLRLRQDLPTLAGLLAALAGCQRLLRPLWRLLQGAPHPLVKASARQLLELLAKVADQERELGCYEVTLAGLELIEGLFQACPVELLALPQEVHETLGLPSFARPSGLPQGDEEVLGPLLDYVMATFSRCGYWPCRSLSDRWGLEQGCLRVVMALMPAMECFNWPEAAKLAASQRDSLSTSLQRLAELQLRVMRSWGEVSYVEHLLQCLRCEVAFGPESPDGFRRFVGFRSSALELATTAVSVCVSRVPCTGPELLGSALRCLHGLLAMFLSPAGHAPHMQPLAQHVLELVGKRESLGPSMGTEPRRADLVQSLYAHLCGPHPELSTWAAECLVSLCALWCRTEMQHMETKGQGLLLASLSVPSEGAGLGRHLAKRLVELLGDGSQPMELRSACGDLLRASLVSQRLMETEDLPRCVRAASAAVEEKEPRLVFVALSLLDDLAGLKQEQVLESFNQEVKVGKTSYDSVWKLLQEAFERLQSQLSTPQAVLSVCAVLRLAQRGAEQQPVPAALDLLKRLLSTRTLETLNAEARLPAAPEGSQAPELQREVSFGAFRGAQAFATKAKDFETLQHPYGSAPEGVPRTQWLSQLELRRQVLSPSISAAGSAALAQGSWANRGGAAASLAALEASGRPSVPRCLRAWGELCEMACGEALATATEPLEGRELLRSSLPLERLGCFGSRLSSHCGLDVVDARVLPLQPLRPEVVRLAAACAAADGLQRPCVDEDPVLEALRKLMEKLPEISSEEAMQVAGAFAFEAFDDLAKTAARLEQKGRLEGVFAPLLWGVTHHLYYSLQRLEHFMEKPQLFATFLGLCSHLFASSAHARPAGRAYGSYRPKDTGGPVDDMLRRETPAGLALVGHLTVVLRSVVSQPGRLLPRAAQMLAAAGLLTASAEAYEGVLDSHDGLHSEVLLHCLSLLLQLVPALAEPGASGGSLQALPLLTTLIEVLGQLIESMMMSEEASERQLRQNQVAQVARWADLIQVAQDVKMEADGPTPGWPARVASGGGQHFGGLQILQTPEDALIRESSETQAEKLDEILHSGFSSLVFAVTKQTLLALRAREDASAKDLANTLLRQVLLPRILKCSLFAPVADPTGSSSLERFLRSDVSRGLWQRASEASWACRLDSVVTFLLQVARTRSGAALLTEQRLFVLLAYCPLLRRFVLNTESAYVVPSNSVDNASMVLAEHRRFGELSAWRRPAHSTWLRVLLLIASMLASGAKPEEADIFLQVYRSRFCYIFQSALQSGRLAVLEEAALMSRVLAFLSPCSPLARALSEDAAAQSMIFIMGSCLTERAAVSETFLPRSREERRAAQVPEVALDGETTPAQVPSIFHQRVEYLGLELLRNLLLALLRITSGATWLASGARTVLVQQMAQGWPTAYQSIFGLKDGGSVQADPVRLWAVLMDVSLEAGRKAVEYLETLKSPKEELHRLLIEKSAVGGDAWLPLSLALVGVGELSADSSSPAGFSPSHLAMGLTPMAVPHSPTRKAQSPPLGPEKSRSHRRALRYSYAARRPHETLGGQHSTVAPEGVTLSELKKLACNVLELSCTLLCRFCQVTKSSTQGPRSPGVAVLYGLLSFLHEILSTETGIDHETLAFLGALHAKEQQLGTEATVLQESGDQPNPAFDGDAWLLGEL